LAWSGAFLAIHLASPRAMGFGDVRLALLLGLTTGWLGWPNTVLAFFTSNVLGAVVGLLLIGLGRRRRDQPIPFGVFLASGTTLTFLVGPWLLAHWHHWPSH